MEVSLARKTTLGEGLKGELGGTQAVPRAWTPAGTNQGGGNSQKLAQFVACGPTQGQAQLRARDGWRPQVQVQGGKGKDEGSL